MFSAEPSDADRRYSRALRQVCCRSADVEGGNLKVRMSHGNPVVFTRLLGALLVARYLVYGRDSLWGNKGSWIVEDVETSREVAVGGRPKEQSQWHDAKVNEVICTDQ